jgi:PAS domain S-box-containing protein
MHQPEVFMKNETCDEEPGLGGDFPEARLRTLFNLAPVAIAILDDKLQIQSVNPAYCALAGSPAEELIGVAAAPIIGAQHADQATGRFSLARKDGTSAEIEWRIAKELGTGSCILVAIDVTLQVQAERARQSLLASERAARTEAARSNRLKEEFLAALSHELRNPLNAILGWATILSRKHDLPQPVIQGLEAIERNSRLQARMISDLLDYAGDIPSSPTETETETEPGSTGRGPL